ncbi:alpha/beta fold hydrolase [Actinosynnema sp. NPDC020468]|uniref:alpha/beta fold hydrolase n=1 Tax=Actinosynnema sp. NPDC020468 TaxID=3154488 RepID=UPI0033DA6C04
MTHIATAAGTFDALVAGPEDGPEVLLLHGFPEFALEWEHQLHALADAGHRAVAYDQRGYSPGVRPDEESQYRLEHAVGDVFAVADSLGWQRFHLVGHDWGAAVAWIAAAERPDRVRTLSAVSVPHPAAFGAALRDDPEQQQASRYMAMFRQPAPGPEQAILARGALDLPGVPADHLAEYLRRLAEPGALTGALNWYRANELSGGYDKPVTVPTLYVVGDQDSAVARSGIDATADWVTGPYRLELLEGVGHFTPEEVPDTVSELILAHLREHPGDR